MTSDRIEPLPNRRPHSPACWKRPHPHGMLCSRSCPTCGGGPEPSDGKIVGPERNETQVDTLP